MTRAAYKTARATPENQRVATNSRFLHSLVWPARTYKTERVAHHDRSMDDHVVFITVVFVAEGMHGHEGPCGQREENRDGPTSLHHARGGRLSLADQEPPLLLHS